MSNLYKLYLVTDQNMMNPLNIVEVIECAVQNGVTCVQLREKNMETRDFVELGHIVKKKLNRHNTPLFINDRIDVAQVIQCDGVHLGQSDIDYESARKILGHNFKIGLTINTLADYNKYKNKNIDYFGLSTIYPTQTKSDVNSVWKASDIALLNSNTPLIGIGGINEKNAKQTLELGLDGIAVVSAICSNKSLIKVQEKVKALNNIVGSYYELKQ